MPIYVYRCSSCSFQNEHLQKMSDPRLTDCPKCGKPEYQKMLTAAGFQLKGSGWYATDFKGGAAAPAAKTEGDAKASDAKAGGSDAAPTPAKAESTPTATPAAASSSAPASTGTAAT